MMDTERLKAIAPPSRSSHLIIRNAQQVSTFHRNLSKHLSALLMKKTIRKTHAMHGMFLPAFAFLRRSVWFSEARTDALLLWLLDFVTARKLSFL